MDEELIATYRNAIYNLRNILVKLQDTKTDIKNVREGMGENLLINDKIINDTEISNIENLLDDNIKRITNTIYSLSSKI